MKLRPVRQVVHAETMAMPWRKFRRAYQQGLIAAGPSARLRGNVSVALHLGAAFCASAVCGAVPA